jgi:hypothetical protein
VSAYAARLKGTVDLDSVCEDLAGVVYQPWNPPQVSVWIAESERRWSPDKPGRQTTNDIGHGIGVLNDGAEDKAVRNPGNVTGWLS